MTRKLSGDELGGNDVRLLITHRIYSLLDHAHNARMNTNRYHRHSVSETVFLSIKRTLGSPCMRGVETKDT